MSPFESVAEMENCSNLPAIADLLPIGLSTGGAFPTATVTVIASKSVSEPSETVKVTLG